MTAPTSPSSDSLAAVVAELRNPLCFMNDNDATNGNVWADRIERLDAEMRKERDKLRTDICESIADTEELRARLAACEVTEEMLDEASLQAVGRGYSGDHEIARPDLWSIIHAALSAPLPDGRS